MPSIGIVRDPQFVAGLPTCLNRWPGFVSVIGIDATPKPADFPASDPQEAIGAEVFVYSNQSLLAKFAIEHGEYIVGRDAACHILVDADEVSRHHARLTFSGFELLIEDLGSSNGVYIDGVQVQI